MAGTLLRLRDAGWELHYLNLASGDCGSMIHGPAATRRIRRAEARDAARSLGARWHPPFVDDAGIFYADDLLRRVTAVVRTVKPAILLTHSPQDYMEDHMNACRLAVTAAFVRGMPNYRTRPARPAVPGDCTVYHALPHGLRDGLGWRVEAGLYVNTTPVQDAKREDIPRGVLLVVVDEASMVTDELMLAVLDMAPPGARVVLVGDADQLPPVGGGCVLVDLLGAQPVHCAI